jgi:hypothetical protein
VVLVVVPEVSVEPAHVQAVAAVRQAWEVLVAVVVVAVPVAAEAVVALAAAAEVVVAAVEAVAAVEDEGGK